VRGADPPPAPATFARDSHEPEYGRVASKVDADGTSMPIDHWLTTTALVGYSHAGPLFLLFAHPKGTRRGGGA
jgi:hypothetical protein